MDVGPLKVWIFLVYGIHFLLMRILIFVLKLFWKMGEILKLCFFFYGVNFIFLEYWGWLMTAFFFFFLRLKFGILMLGYGLWNQMLRTMIRLVPYDRNIQSQSSGGGAKSTRGIFESLNNVCTVNILITMILRANE